MPLFGTKKDGLLAKVNFPLYAIQMVTNRHVIVAGGGGSSKTGVANGFEIFEISYDGKKFIAEEVIRFETGPNVVMNCTTFSDSRNTYLVAGCENRCQLYNIQTEVIPEDTTDAITAATEETTVRSRFKNRKQIAEKKKKLKFAFRATDSVHSDFGPDSCQRVVRINLNGRTMATGGTDGMIRLWTFPSLRNNLILKAHEREIDDLDFNPYEKRLVSIAKDGLAIIWNYVTGREVKRLTWEHPDGVKYLYKRCRFARVENESKSVLFMISNPLSRGSKLKGYLQLWNPEDGELKKFVPIEECLSALAVRDDGRFVAIGTMYSGSVSIYVAFSLQCILHVRGAHSMFVTGLEFLPNEDNCTVSNVSEVAVLSISVDNKICIHNVPHRAFIPFWFGIAFIVVALFFCFLFCSYVNI